MLKRIMSLFLALIITFTLVIPRHSPAFATQTTLFQLSDSGISYLKKEEGFSSKPYWDYTQYTVGYGSKCPSDKLEEYKQNGISKEDAELLLATHISSLETNVNQFISQNSLNLTQNQFDALICFSYNVGSAWMSDKTSEFRKAVLDNNTSSTFVRELVLWSKAGGNRLDGLVKRRLRDANMYLNGDYTTNTPSTLGYIYYAPNGGIIKNNVQGFIFNETPTPIEIPSWANHEFMGWYTEQIGGQKVENLTKDLNGKTLYAHWDTEEGSIPEPIKPVNVKVIGDGVNLREGCGTSYKIIGQAKRNDVLIITEVGEGSGYTWGKSEKGWIALSYTNYNDVISGKVQEPSKDEIPEITEPEPTPPKPTEHVHKYTSTVISPTCNNSGYTKHVCECGDTYSDSTTTPLGHSFGNWQEVKKPTTATEGSEKRICSRCKKEEIRTIEKLPESTSPSVPEQSKEELPQTVIDKGTIKVNDYLAVRGGAGTNYKEVARLYNGNRIEIFEITTKNSLRWGKVENGWVCLKYVSLDSEPITKPEQNLNNTPPVQKPVTEAPNQEIIPDISTPCYGVVNVKEVLYVRWGPSTSYLAIDSLRNGIRVEILEVKSSNGMIWGRIGENRWINLDYVKIEEKVKADEIVEEECFESAIEMKPEETENIELMMDLAIEENNDILIEETKKENNIVETQESSENEIIDISDSKTELEKEPVWIIKFFLFIVNIVETLLLK